MKRYMYHCPACKTSEETKLGPFSLARYRCKHCHAKLRSSGLSPEQWNALTDEERARVYTLASSELCENKRFFNLLLIALCAILCLCNWLAPILTGSRVNLPVLLGCAVAYAVIYDSDCVKRFARNGEKVLEQLKKEPEPKEDPAAQAD